MNRLELAARHREAMGVPRKASEQAMAAYAAAFRDVLGEEPSSRFHGPRRLASRRELRDLLKASGLPRAAAAKVAQAGWQALEPDAAEAERKVTALRDLANRLKES